MECWGKDVRKGRRRGRRKCGEVNGVENGVEDERWEDERTKEIMKIQRRKSLRKANPKHATKNRR